LESVFAVIVFVLLLNVPLAPLPGALNVTEVPGMVTLAASLMTTVRAVENAVPTVAL
jgi:hypothetical protein